MAIAATSDSSNAKKDSIEKSFLADVAAIDYRLSASFNICGIQFLRITGIVDFYTIKN